AIRARRADRDRARLHGAHAVRALGQHARRARHAADLARRQAREQRTRRAAPLKLALDIIRLTGRVRDAICLSAILPIKQYASPPTIVPYRRGIIMRGAKANKKDVLKDSVVNQASLPSERRLRCVIELSSDYYWEQDENPRCTLRLHRNASQPENDPQLFLGKTSWELGGIPADGGTWEEHKALREARRPFEDFVVCRSNAAIGERYLSISGQPVFGARGEFQGYSGIAKDVTKERRHKRLLKLERVVMGALGDAADTTDALPAAIRAICESERWEAGQYWSLDEKSNVMRFHSGWSIADTTVERVSAQARDLALAPGDGLVGAVWQHQQPLWVPDLGKERRVLRKGIEKQTGWKRALLFPVFSRGEII